MSDDRTPKRLLHPETLAIRTQATRTAEREHSVPLFLTSSFVFDSAEQARALFADELPGNIYSRYSNPNTDEFVRKLCLLEGAEEGLAFASGMAAVFASLAALVRAGDHIVASRALFGSTHQLLTQLLPRWGVTSTYVDPAAPPEAWAAAVRPETKLVFVETPSNPGLDLVDLEWLGSFCRGRGLTFVVDNCFTTPVLQQPIRFGADLVVHSATKFIDGQGRTLGGAAVGSTRLIAELRWFARHTGPALAPFNAWVLSKSVETLALRMERHCANALALASHFDGHPELEQVRYPFLPSHPQHALARRQMSAGGGIVVLVVRGGLERARRFLDALQLLSHSPNLGDARSIVTHPTSTTHSKLSEDERRALGILPGLVRISVGLEHVDDVIADVAQALARSAGPASDSASAGGVGAALPESLHTAGVRA
jgi:O-succinylhomoserine sulfhydrylase